MDTNDSRRDVRLFAAFLSVAFVFVAITVTTSATRAQPVTSAGTVTIANATAATLKVAATCNGTGPVYELANNKVMIVPPGGSSWPRCAQYVVVTSYQGTAHHWIVATGHRYRFVVLGGEFKLQPT